jgi:hypothetical protein
VTQSLKLAADVPRRSGLLGQVRRVAAVFEHLIKVTPLNAETGQVGQDAASPSE